MKREPHNCKYLQISALKIIKGENYEYQKSINKIAVKLSAYLTIYFSKLKMPYFISSN